MTHTIKPLESIFNGYRFRSRLEARWAVFFDAAGIQYEYEPEGFDLDGTWYLPDFWLPEAQQWVEVKPYPLNISYLSKPSRLCHLTGHATLLIVGRPWLPEQAPSTWEGICLTRTTDGARGTGGSWWMECEECHHISFGPLVLSQFTCPLEKAPRRQLRDGPKLLYAYTKARQARFE